MLKGKTAVITGASRGIGAAVAVKLAARGADIAVIYAGNVEAANQVCKECIEQYGVKAVAYKCKDRKSTRLNSSHGAKSRMPSSA